jgi:arylsulfatase A-like enzyme
MDRLAAESLVFQNAISSSPWTMPSVASLLTGLPPSVHRQRSIRTSLSNNITTIAEFLKTSGYVTCAIGDNKFLTEEFNMSQGFDVYNFYPKKAASGLTTISTRAITNWANDWVSRNAGSRFFMWIHYFDPHLPYAPPEEYLPKQEPLPSVGKSFDRLDEIRDGSFVPTPEEREWIRELYHSEVRYVDDCVGMFLANLRKLGIYGDSLVIITSDHGEEFWEHDGFEHGHTVYNELLSVPLIVKLPQQVEQRTFTRMVSLESILPALLDLWEIEYDQTLYAADSLVPLWTEPEKMGPEDPIVSSELFYGENRVSVIFDGMKYIRTVRTRREEFYDLRRDPLEKLDLVGSAGERIDPYRQLLVEHLQMARTLINRHGIQAQQTITPDRATIEHLRSLGYVK